MVKVSRWLPLVFLVLFLFQGQVNAAEEGTVQIGLTPNPLTVEVFAPAEVYKDRRFIVRAYIWNLGDERITRAVATIHFDKKSLSLGGRKPEQQIGTIPPHRIKFVTWSVEAKKMGNYIILVSVTGNGITGELTAQDTVMVTVEERHQRFFNFFRDWWRRFFG